MALSSSGEEWFDADADNLLIENIDSQSQKKPETLVRIRVANEG